MHIEHTRQLILGILGGVVGLAEFTRALDIRETKLGPNNSSTVRTHKEVFRLRAALGAATNQPAR